jgi:hypothetical protein
MRGLAKQAVLMAGKMLGPAVLLTAPAVSGNTTQSGNLAPVAGTYSNAASVVTKLFRLGGEVSSPYAKGVNDALCAFWARDTVTGSDGSVQYFYSSSLIVASTAGATPTYTKVRIRILQNQNGGNSVQMGGIRFYDSSLALLTGTYSTSGTLVSGTLSALSDNNAETACRIDGAPYNVDLDIGSAKTLHGGRVDLMAQSGNYTGSIGNFEIYGWDGSSWTLLGSYDKANAAQGGNGTPNNYWSYSYGVYKQFNIGSYGALSLTNVSYNATSDQTTHSVTGLSGTLQYRVLDVTDVNKPAEIVGWTNTSSGAAVGATVGGILRYDYRDSDNQAAAVSWPQEVAVVGIRPSKLGTNIGFTYGKPTWAKDFSLYRDLIDQAVFTDNSNASLPMGGAHVDLNNRLIAWPSGASFVRLNVGWFLHDDDVGEREWLSGGVYTRANYGTAWNIENIAGSGISVNTTADGPNGGVLITYGDGAFADTYIRLLSLPAPMTANSLRRTNDAQPGLLLTDSFIASLAIYNGPLRWMWFGMEGVSSTSMPLPSDSGWAAYMASFPSWANRRMKGFRPEVMAEASNRSGLDPYVNFPVCAGDDYISSFGAFMAANLDAGLNLRAAGHNEVWNTAAGYVGGNGTHLYLGWAAGYGGASPNRVPVSVVRNTQSDHNVSGAYATGTILFSYLSGTSWNSSIFQANRDTAPGTTLPTGGAGSSNADWTCLADTTTGGSNGSATTWRYYGVRLAHICTVLKAAMGSGRVIPTAENWVNASDMSDRIGHVATFSEVAGGPALADVCAGVWDWNVGHYWAQRGISTSAAPGNAASGVTRQAAILAQLQSDLATDIATGTIAKMVAARPMVAAINAAARTVNGHSVRYSPALANVGGYECCNDHMTVPTAPVAATGDDVALVADLNAVHRSADYEASFTSGLVATFAHGGAHCAFLQGPLVSNQGNDFSIHDKIPFNPASLVRGREKSLVDFAATL